jgi:hypothetical protein
LIVMVRTGLGRAALLLAVAASTAACNLSGSSGGGPQPTITTTHTHQTVVIVKRHQVLNVGDTAELGTPGQAAAATMTVGKPKISTKALSSYAYAPEYGYYVTFPITIVDTGQQTIVINRLDFWVDTPGLGRENNNGGHAPFSGAHTQLDTTPLSPGDRVHNYLTFDVSHPTGTFVYGPNHRLSVSWRF